VICDEHNVEMVRIFVACWYECPIGNCRSRLSDEELERLGDVKEVYVL
jgi:hypothetical protein